MRSWTAEAFLTAMASLPGQGRIFMTTEAKFKYRRQRACSLRPRCFQYRERKKLHPYRGTWAADCRMVVPSSGARLLVLVQCLFRCTLCLLQLRDQSPYFHNLLIKRTSCLFPHRIVVDYCRMHGQALTTKRCNTTGKATIPGAAHAERRHASNWGLCDTPQKFHEASPVSESKSF